MKGCLFALLPFIFLSAAAQKIVYFEKTPFDGDSQLIGIPYLGADTAHNYKRFAFIIDSKKGFEELQREWIFENKTIGRKDQNSFDLFLVKNKDVERIGTIYPGSNTIKTSSGFYQCDTTLLIKLAKEHPLHYYVRKETFESRAAFLATHDSAIKQPKCIFAFGPGKYDGSFLILVPKTDSVQTPVAAMDMLDRKLAAFTDKENFSLRYTLTQAIKNDPDKIAVTVDCIRAVYDQYNDPVAIKVSWKPEQIFMTSLWKK